jgi:hypothetical protein
MQNDKWLTPKKEYRRRRMITDIKMGDAEQEAQKHEIMSHIIMGKRALDDDKTQ